MTKTKILGAVRHCPKCQTETERYVKGQCKPCARSSNAAWIAANPDKHKSLMSTYRANNSDKAKAYAAAYRNASPERKAKANANTTAWAIANADKIKEYETSPERKAKRRARYAENPDKAKAAIGAWKKANPESRRIHNNNRRARKLSNGGILSKGLSTKLFTLQKGKCTCCGMPLGNKFHLDHIMPLSLGGSNTDDNMQLLRQSCNNQKHAKHPIDFMQQRGFLL